MEVDQKGKIERGQDNGRQCPITLDFFHNPHLRSGQETLPRRNIFFKKSMTARSGRVIFQQVEFS